MLCKDLVVFQKRAGGKSASLRCRQLGQSFSLRRGKAAVSIPVCPSPRPGHQKAWQGDGDGPSQSAAFSLSELLLGLVPK